MKTQEEVERAINLILLATSGQVKLDPPMTSEVRDQLISMADGLIWLLGKGVKAGKLDEWFDEVEEATKSMGFNPHVEVTE